MKRTTDCADARVRVIESVAEKVRTGLKVGEIVRCKDIELKRVLMKMSKIQLSERE